MADEKPSEEKVRKTFSLSTRQALGGLTVGGALIAVQPLFNMFQTRDSARAQEKVLELQLESQKERILGIETAIRDVNKNVSDSKDEVITMLRRLSDSQKAAAAAAENRQKTVDDRQDRHIELLEANAIGGSKHKTN